VHGLTYLAAVENIFRIDGELGHEIVFLYSGRLDPLPATANAALIEIDGNVVPVVWRSFREDAESLPLYPTAALSWVHDLSERQALNRGRQPDAAREEA
jgi:hypothetical protein